MLQARRPNAEKAWYQRLPGMVGYTFMGTEITHAHTQQLQHALTIHPPTQGQAFGDGVVQEGSVKERVCDPGVRRIQIFSRR